MAAHCCLFFLGLRAGASLLWLVLWPTPHLAVFLVPGETELGVSLLSCRGHSRPP